jgi:hypothetical protein
MLTEYRAKTPTLIALWLCLLGVLVLASAAEALTAALLWSTPAALLATLLSQALNTPRHAWLAALAGLCWQLALLAAYFPVQSWAVSPGVGQGGTWPGHLLVVGAALLVLVLGFLLGFVLPGLGMRREVLHCRLTLEHDAAPLATLTPRLYDSARWLRSAWLHYQAARHAWQARGSQGGGASSDQAVDPRDFFEPGMALRMALRADFFRHLPGILTGIGIIGTFTGLILSLRGFDVSGDAREQVSQLVRHVGEAFLASAAAITLAVLVNVVEKLMSAGLERELELLIASLRLRAGQEAVTPASKARSPLEPSASGVPSDTLAQAAPNATAVHMPEPSPNITAPVPPAAIVSAPEPTGLSEPVHASGLQKRPQSTAGVQPLLGKDSGTGATDAAVLGALQRSLEAQSGATESLNQLSRAMTESLNQHLSMQTANNQQIMLLSKQMGSRLEAALASQEAQQKKLLESMSARLVQSEMKLMERHRSDTEMLASLVRRIEVLISLVRADQDRGSTVPGLFDEDNQQTDVSPVNGSNGRGYNGDLGFGSVDESSGFSGVGNESYGRWDDLFGNNRPKGRFEP